MDEQLPLPILEDGLIADKYDELWHAAFNDRHKNYLGPRDKVLLALARNPTLKLEAERQKPLLRWLDTDLKFRTVKPAQISMALVFMHRYAGLTIAELNYLQELFNVDLLQTG